MINKFVLVLAIKQSNSVICIQVSVAGREPIPTLMLETLMLETLMLETLMLETVSLTCFCYYNHAQWLA